MALADPDDPVSAGRRQVVALAGRSWRDPQYRPGQVGTTFTAAVLLRVVGPAVAHAVDKPCHKLKRSLTCTASGAPSAMPCRYMGEPSRQTTARNENSKYWLFRSTFPLNRGAASASAGKVAFPCSADCYLPLGPASSAPVRSRGSVTSFSGSSPA